MSQEKLELSSALTVDPLHHCEMTLLGTVRGMREEPEVIKVKANSVAVGSAFHFTNDTSLALRARHRGLFKTVINLMPFMPTRPSLSEWEAGENSV